MTDDLIYSERVSSSKTELLFIVLTALFAVLSVWRVRRVRAARLARLLPFFAMLFLFYSLNYRTLIIRLSPEAIKLKFGVFSWTAPLANIADCRHDDLPALMRLGGAGIHFMAVDNRYRVSFNFLEHPRVVIALKRKTGPVQDISFSTQQPDRVIQLVHNTLAAKQIDNTRTIFGG